MSIFDEKFACNGHEQSTSVTRKFQSWSFLTDRATPHWQSRLVISHTAGKLFLLTFKLARCLIGRKKIDSQPEC